MGGRPSRATGAPQVSLPLSLALALSLFVYLSISLSGVTGAPQVRFATKIPTRLLWDVTGSYAIALERDWKLQAC